MDKFGVKKNGHNSTCVENDCIVITKSLRKNEKLDDNQKWINNGLMVRNIDGCRYNCFPCGFKSNNLKDYKRHLKTNKHAKKTPKKSQKDLGNKHT